jgi:hypothetical protein
MNQEGSKSVADINRLIEEINEAAQNGSVDLYARLSRKLPNTEPFNQVRAAIDHNLSLYKASALGYRTTTDGRIIYSMKNEELIAEALISKLNSRSNFIIDIGASDGLDWSNSYTLYKSGFNGISIEGNKAKASALISNYANLDGKISVVNAFVKPKVINQLLGGLDTPLSPDFVSVDIDSFEYDLIETMLLCYRPKIICVQNNERLPPPIHYIMRYSENLPQRDMTLISSASISAWSKLFQAHNYKLFRLEYNNLFAIDSQLNEFRPFAYRTTKAVYDDFQALRDREVLFPWNSKIFESSLQEEGLNNFTELDNAKILEVFSSFLKKMNIEAAATELSLDYQQI